MGLADVWSFMGRFSICISNIMREHKSMNINQLDLITHNDSIKAELNCVT